MEITREFVLDLLRQKDFDPDFNIRLRARAREVCPVLLEVASGEAEEADLYMRKNAIAMLGTAGDEDCVEALVNLLEEEHMELRANAIRCLGKIASPKAAPGLEARLADKALTPTEGKIIVAALAQIGQPDSARSIAAFRRQFAKKKKESAGLARDLQAMDETIEVLKAKG